MNRYDRVVIAATLLCIVDGLMTIPYWQHESNPVVLQLGAGGMLTVKLIGVIGLCALWFYWDGVRDSSIAKTSVVSLCALYGLVVITNVWYLLL